MRMIFEINVKETLNLPDIFLSYSSEKDSEIGLEKCEEWNKLRELKNRIDNYEIKDWDKNKKMTNPYELIYMPSRKVKYESIAYIDPLSRSYFKMWELLFNHSFLPYENKCETILNIAEGPGGFIEALVNYRKKYHSACDKINAITLKSTNKEIPGWDKSYQFLVENKNVKIHYGEDGTGNIYNVENIKHLRKYIKSNNELATLITADGGFDYSKNFNNQEASSYRIIFCEIVTAICNQAIGGTFICKMFDTYSQFSKFFIYLLCSCYSYVFFHKPVTSRPANSEKYIICRHFRGIPEKYIQKLFIVIKSWDLLEKEGFKVDNIFKGEIPKDLDDKINNLNTLHYNHQKKSIEDTINLIENKPNLSALNKIIKNQVVYAKKWCEKYDIPVNNKSTFLDK